MRGVSIRLRITLIAAALVAVVLLLASVVVVVLQRSQSLGNLDRSLTAEAERLTTTVDPNLGPERFAQLVVDGVVVSSTDNAAPYGPVVGAPSGGDEFRTVGDLPLEDDAYRILVRSADDGSADFLVVGENIDDLNDSVRALAITLAAMIPIVTGALALMVWGLVGRTLGPVEEIRAEVEALGPNQLDARVPEPNTDDEIARLASTMNQMLARLEEASTRQRRFVSDASHELRSPIARMRTELEVELAAVEDQDFQTVANSALEETIGLQRLVEDLLFLARSDERAGLSSSQPVNLDAVVREQIAALEKSPAVIVEAAAVEDCTVVGSRSQLGRLVRNLLENAVRHARSKVQVSLQASPTGCRLVVADDGPGIATEFREQVFERFARVDEARTSGDGGSGLGLAIVKDIAERHGGQVWVEAGGANGATLVVEL